MGWFSNWRNARHTLRIVEGEEYRAEFRRRLNARYDAAHTTAENENHWANADGLGRHVGRGLRGEGESSSLMKRTQVAHILPAGISSEFRGHWRCQTSP